MQTPAGLTISPRDVAFSRNGAPLRWWLRNDALATAFSNALSASFPMGERFFIDSVRRFRDQADETLKEQITQFMAQESMHTREHLAFNRHIVEAGYDLSRIEAYLKRRLAWSRKQLPICQLAGTAALEHFTAILAHALLSDPRHLSGAANDIGLLWRWHAIEEIEHKAVAFDTYRAATRDMPAILRWALRCQVMAITTLLFFIELSYSIAQFLRQDGINAPATWLKLLHFLFVDPGVMASVMRRYFHYYRPGFHPWDVDDRALIAGVEAEIRACHA